MKANHGWIDRRISLLGCLGLAALVLGGCSQNLSPRAAAAPFMLAEKAAPLMARVAQAAPNTLSREHAIEVVVSESDLDTAFRRVVDRCSGDSAHHCAVLNSDLSSGERPNGFIRLRTDPESVQALTAFVAALGKLQHRSTTVEDLGDAMQDTQSRIAMLTDYRKQLLVLQSKAVTNIDAAIKIASELSTVQSNLEQASGEAANQTKRTTTETMQITLSVPEHQAFLRPIRQALENFLGDLSIGLAQAIRAVAYLVPWLLVILPVLYLLRFLWRRRR